MRWLVNNGFEECGKMPPIGKAPLERIQANDYAKPHRTGSSNIALKPPHFFNDAFAFERNQLDQTRESIAKGKTQGLAWLLWLASVALNLRGYETSVVLQKFFGIRSCPKAYNGLVSSLIQTASCRGCNNEKRSAR